MRQIRVVPLSVALLLLTATSALAQTGRTAGKSPSTITGIESLLKWKPGSGLGTPRSGSGVAGVLSKNRYLPGSTSGVGSRYSASSPANPYGTYGSRYSQNGARNPYATRGLDIIGQDGAYLGKLNSNPYDPNSVSNPYGKYGSRYSRTSINNPYSRYGSPYSSYSAQNPYASSPPLLLIPGQRTLRGTTGAYIPSFGAPSLPTLPRLPTLPTVWSPRIRRY